MCKALQCVNQQPEGQCIGNGTYTVKFMFGFRRRIMGQQFVPNDKCGKPQRNIDDKQPVPASQCQDASGNGWTGSSRNRYYHSIYTHAASQYLWRID